MIISTAAVRRIYSLVCLFYLFFYFFGVRERSARRIHVQRRRRRVECGPVSAQLALTWHTHTRETRNTMGNIALLPGRLVRVCVQAACTRTRRVLFLFFFFKRAPNNIRVKKETGKRECMCERDSNKPGFQLLLLLLLQSSVGRCRRGGRDKHRRRV